jgi:hypothetical protein
MQARDNQAVSGACLRPVLYYAGVCHAAPWNLVAGFPPMRVTIRLGHNGPPSRAGVAYAGNRSNA